MREEFFGGAGTIPLPGWRAVVVPERRAAAWTADDLAALRETGFAAAIVEHETVDAALVKRVRSAGLQYCAALPVFHDPGGAEVASRPELVPVDADGRQYAYADWYHPVNPTVGWWRQRRLAQVEAIARECDGMFLDFLRWPLRWEEAMRDGREPAGYGFDHETLAQFRRSASVAMDGVALTEWIAGAGREVWHGWRVRVIREVAREASRRAKGVAGAAFPVGAFVVPEPAWRGITGQDAGVLSQVVDVVAPMLYRRILGRDEAWMRQTLAAFRILAGEKAVPVVEEWAADFDPVIVLNA